MKINSNYIDKRGNVYEGVTERALTKGELFDLGKLVHQTEREKNAFGKENGVYIYQDRDNENIAYRIYDEFADYGFNGYSDDKLIYELNKRKDNVKLTDFPSGIVTCDDNIIGQIIPYYPNSETIFNYAKRTNNINIVRYYRKIISIIDELYKNCIIYVDAHAKNFVIVNNDIKLIDFDYSLINFDNSKFSYDNMISTLCNMINILNSLIGMEYNVDNKSVRDLQDMGEVVKYLEKRL